MRAGRECRIQIVSESWREGVRDEEREGEREGGGGGGG